MNNFFFFASGLFSCFLHHHLFNVGRLLALNKHSTLNKRLNLNILISVEVLTVLVFGFRIIL